MKKIIILATFIALLFGTNNYEELNNLAIITNIGITKNKNNYNLLMQEIIPYKNGDNINNKYSYYYAKCKNIKACFLDIRNKNTKNIYLNHLNNLIINTDDYNYLYYINDSIFENIDSFNVVLTNNDIKKVITYNKNYRYINSLINNKTTYQDIKKSKLNKTKLNIPLISLKNDKLVFYKYIELGEENEK